MYHGSFEANFWKMKAGATSFMGSDGSQHEIPDWPEEADGLRIGYMEKAGKRFVAVRVMDDKSDIMLGNELLIDPPSHMGYGKRFSPEPTIIEDETGELFMVVGGQGGSRIITVVWQAISNVIDFGMAPDAAIGAQRFHHQHLPDNIALEEESITKEVDEAAIPNIEIIEINEMKVLRLARLLARV